MDSSTAPGGGIASTIFRSGGEPLRARGAPSTLERKATLRLAVAVHPWPFQPRTVKPGILAKRRTGLAEAG